MWLTSLVNFNVCKASSLVGDKIKALAPVYWLQTKKTLTYPVLPFIILALIISTIHFSIWLLPFLWELHTGTQSVTNSYSPCFLVQYNYKP